MYIQIHLCEKLILKCYSQIEDPMFQHLTPDPFSRVQTGRAVNAETLTHEQAIIIMMHTVYKHIFTQNNIHSAKQKNSLFNQSLDTWLTHYYDTVYR